jgi:hypothetical protein
VICQSLIICEKDYFSDYDPDQFLKDADERPVCVKEVPVTFEAKFFVDE